MTSSFSTFQKQREITGLEDLLKTVAAQFPKPAVDKLDVARSQYARLKNHQQPIQTVQGTKTLGNVTTKTRSQFGDLEAVIQQAESYNVKGLRKARAEFETLLLGYQMSEQKKPKQDFAKSMPPVHLSKSEPISASNPVLEKMAQSTVMSTSVIVEKTDGSKPSVNRLDSLPGGNENVTIPKEEYDMLVKSKQISKLEIEELTNRLSRFASRQLSDQNPNIVDLSDKNRPTKIGEKFSELYDNEWTDAFETLIDIYKSDEEVIGKLLEILRLVYWSCKQIAVQQLQRMEVYMEMLMTEIKWTPENIRQSYRCQRPPSDPKVLNCTHKHTKDYRKSAAIASVPAVAQIFKDIVFCCSFTDINLNKMKELDLYVDACVECVWLMVVQDPSMCLQWAKPGERIDADTFKCFKKKGDVVKYCVWPALYLHKGGPLVSKGFVYPQQSA